jgi:hypothetical protein
MKDYVASYKMPEIWLKPQRTGPLIGRFFITLECDGRTIAPAPEVPY